jgi:type I restriction enzyme R subunit
MPKAESEKETRKKRINTQLTALGWTFAPEGEPAPQGPYWRDEVETDNGPCDYGLYVDDKLIGLVEAKKLSLAPQNVLSQTERYAEGIKGQYASNGYGVPFIYASNGEVIWCRDTRHDLNRSRKIAAFHSPNGLAEMVERNLDSTALWFGQHPSDHPWLRYYQHEACTAIENAIADRKRQMLVAMATGTGKTYTLVNEIYRLLKSKAAKRVLFLVDRRALAAQAIRTFASFEPEPAQKFDKLYEVYSQRFFRHDLGGEGAFDPNVLPTKYLTEPTKGQTFVYVSTIQRTAVNLWGKEAVFGEDFESQEEDDADKLDIPTHAFDVVIADECHRGYTSSELSVWRKTIDYFDAVKIGLTATPAAHTSSYFKDTVYRYDYERAVKDGFLVDYDVLTFKSDVRVKGIFLKAGEEVGVVDTETGQQQFDLLEDERQFDTTEIERKITSPESTKKILEELKKYTDEHEERYGRFPKTLIFAANDLKHTSHADQIVDIARDVFGQGDAFVRKITGREDRPLQRIREFRNRPKPGIAVSVDLMTTGVDIPDLEFIVFLRPVKSRILFEQMLGRGTRLGEKHPDKSHFTVVDCFDGTLLEYFKQATSITAVPPDKPTKKITQVINEIYENKDRDYNVRCLIKRLQRIDKGMSGEARDLFSVYVADGDMARFAGSLADDLKSNFAKIMKLLRDKGFQDLLINYPRPIRSFLVAVEVQDAVQSEWIVRGADGKDYKPEDYIKAFEQFVRDNPEHVGAIEILLSRPQDWSTDALDELQKKLAKAPQRFTREHLQKAHKLRYDVALADIISMIKHAADDKAPLMTAGQRVDAAMEHFMRTKKFTEEQLEWLKRIRTHLVENLSVDQEDFNVLPIFSRSGGWGRANKTFGGQLMPLLHKLNEAVAA